jgi:hypothetical protein
MTKYIKKTKNYIREKNLPSSSITHQVYYCDVSIFVSQGTARMHMRRNQHDGAGMGGASGAGVRGAPALTSWAPI